KLVRLDRELLNRRGVQSPDADRGEEPDGESQGQRPRDPRQGTADEERGGNRRHAGEDVVGEELGVVVRVADADRDPAAAVDELELVELVADRNGNEEQPGDD